MNGCSGTGIGYANGLLLTCGLSVMQLAGFLVKVNYLRVIQYS